MAKKHSTKTATKEALQSSEPSLLASRQFGGINISNSSFDWDVVLDKEPQRTKQQSDLQTNFLMLQNNVDLANNMTLETRLKDRVVATAPEGYEFTGVAYLKDDLLMCAVKDEDGRQGVAYKVMETIEPWSFVRFSKVAVCDESGWSYQDGGTVLPEGWAVRSVTCMMKSMDESLMVMADCGDTEDQATVFLGPWTSKSVRNYKRLYPNSCGIRPSGITPDMTSETSAVIAWEKSDGTNSWGEGEMPEYVSMITFKWATVNEVGCTEVTDDYLTVYTDTAELEFTMSKFVSFTVDVSAHDDDAVAINWYTAADNQTALMWWKQTSIPEGVSSIKMDWYASMEDDVTDETSGININLMVDDEDHSRGPRATYSTYVDGRMYLWGDPAYPYRVYIGAGTDAELYCSTGAGGGYIDIQQDSSTTVNSLHKWKTTSGASIVTCLCGNNNTGRVKRYNIIETSTSLTNTISGVSYTAEEVANVVGSNSKHASGVFENGLYVLTRYGLALDTAQMEYNGTMQMQFVSDNIKPVFTGRSGLNMDNAYMVYSDGTVYIAFANDRKSNGEYVETELDHVIMVYDMGTKAWWTYTVGEADDRIRALMPIDWIGGDEGLGVVFSDRISLMPNTCILENNDGNPVDFIIQTGEISRSVPQSQSVYVRQIEFRLDWFIGNAEFVVEGTDYYGRQVRIVKSLSRGYVEHDFVFWMEIGYYLENWNISIKGNAAFRMTHWIAKVYPVGNKIGIVYGFDDHSSYKNRHGGRNLTHHAVRCYNDLRDALVP